MHLPALHDFPSAAYEPMLSSMASPRGSSYMSTPTSRSAFASISTPRSTSRSALPPAPAPFRLDAAALMQLLRQIVQPDVTLQATQDISAPTGLETLYLLTLSSGGEPHGARNLDAGARLSDDYEQLVLKLPPEPDTRLLRHEQDPLHVSLRLHQHVEATLVSRADHLPFSIPLLLAHDLSPRTLGTPFLLTTYVAGRSVASLPPSFFSARAWPAFTSAVPAPASNPPVFFPGPHPASPVAAGAVFGPLLSTAPWRSPGGAWRPTFQLLMEAILRDGEDMLISLPYERIRDCVGRLLHHLDDDDDDYVRDDEINDRREGTGTGNENGRETGNRTARPSLILLSALSDEPNLILVSKEDEPRTRWGLRSLTGGAIWGDALMGRVFSPDNGSGAVAMSMSSPDISTSGGVPGGEEWTAETTRVRLLL
ncbi:MAG: hypothetical protein M1838_001908 [Thelocarpon superellum]|nr:MAG: hypothetical protein M1838_001908 [Thelocarpon superellum]